MCAAHALSTMLYTELSPTPDLTCGVPWLETPVDVPPLRSVDLTDRSLVFSAQAGNSKAFDLLVAKYRPRVLKLTLRYMRNHADAEDVAQETFVKAYRALRHFRGECAFYSWLHRIAINAAKSAIQERNRDTSLFAHAVPVDLADDGSNQTGDLDTPEDILLSEEICRVVDAAIGSLCEEQRAAITLCELEGLNYQQVAAVMSSPVGTVRSRIFRARETIDRQMRRLLDAGLNRHRRPYVSPALKVRGERAYRAS